MNIITLVSLLGLVRILEAVVHCDKELNYHHSYGYGFDITCEGLSDQHLKLLRSISVYNEIKLEIINSSLSNVTGEMFSNMKKIRYLIFNNCVIEFNEHGKNFQNLNLLEHLVVANSDIEGLTGNTFKGLERLKELRLTNSGLIHVDLGYLEDLVGLSILDLSHNRIGMLDSLKLCRLSKLKSLFLEHNLMTNFDIDHLGCAKNFSSSNLADINLGYNQISNLSGLHWFTELKYLNLEHNQLEVIRNETFGGLHNLVKLILSNNRIASIESGALKNFSSLELIDLSNNELTSLHLDSLPHLVRLDLANNQLTLKGLVQVKNLTQLEIVDLTNNHLKGLLKSFLLNCTSLSSLNLSDNSLTLDDSSFDLFSNLKELSFRNNSVETISSGMFRNLTNLEALDFSVNKVNSFPDNEIFKQLINLKVLNMSNNQLTQLGYDILQPLISLQVLDIAGNRLQTIDYEPISLLPSLRTINIRSNRLSCNLLAKIIKFFKNKFISYTISEKFEYEEENVAGIYCQEMSNSSGTNNSGDLGLKLSLTLGAVVLVLVIIGVFVFLKFVRSWRRRGYVMDEMELMDD